jgi:hypothetical protein
VSGPPEDLARVLEPGEVILWQGRPRPGRLARKALPSVLFGLPWTAFALLWTALASTPLLSERQAGLSLGGSLCFPLFGLPFVLVGFSLLGAPLWEARRARRTRYLVTDRRVVLLELGQTDSARSLLPAELGGLELRPHRDGSGDLVLLREVEQDSDGDSHTEEIGLWGVEDVKSVHDLVQALSRAR